MPAALGEDVIAPRLRGQFGRASYHFVERCESTQLLLPRDGPEGAVAVTNEQSAGRGRFDRRWEAPAGTSLLLSVLLRPEVEAQRLPTLTVMAAQAVVDALASLGLSASIKEPNDVLVEGRKIAGVLAEASAGVVILGIGLNVNQEIADLPAEPRLPATSARLELQRETDRAHLLLELLLALERRYTDWLVGNAKASTIPG